MLKLCTKCNCEKPTTEFALIKKGDDKLESRCKSCRNIQRKEANARKPKKPRVPRIPIVPNFVGDNIICNKCNREKPKSQFYYNRARKTYALSCRECNNKEQLDYVKTKITDLGYITMVRASEIRYRCKKNNHNREVASDLKELLREQWETQKGLCYYTGLPMTLSNEYHIDPNVMTVDRIDPSKGYIQGNLALCCSLANRMKQDMSIEKLKEMCQTILKHLGVTQGA